MNSERDLDARQTEAIRRDVLESERPLDDMACARIWSEVRARMHERPGRRRGVAGRVPRIGRVAALTLLSFGLPAGAAVVAVELGWKPAPWRADAPARPARRPAPPPAGASVPRPAAPTTEAPARGPEPAGAAAVPPARSGEAPVPPSPVGAPVEAARRAPQTPRPLRRAAAPPAPAARVAALLPPEPPPLDRALDAALDASSRVTPRGLYVEAEASLRAGAREEARQRLEELQERFPADPLASVARYELTLMALRSGDRIAARRHATALATQGGDERLRQRARAILDELARGEEAP